MKRHKTVIISALLLIAMLFSAIGCTEEAEKPSETPAAGTLEQSDSASESGSEKSSVKATTKTTKKPETISYKDRSYPLHTITNKLKLIGRIQTLANGLSCDLTASGIAFKAYVEGKFSFTVDVTGQTTYFTVFVDGERMPTRYSAAAGSNKIIEVGDLGDMALHEIRILKQNQSERSRCVLKTIDFYGSIVEPAKDKELYIEILGDSITCGHGNLWDKTKNNTGDGSETVYEDGTQAYAFLTAEALDADYSIISQSGIGVYRGWTKQTDNGSGYRMMDFYTKASYHRSNSAAYDFSSARVPDVVIINLGTNDNSFSSPKDSFKTYAKNLINHIRDVYGKDVPIVWAHNMMGNCLFSYTAEALNELGGEGAGLYSVQLNQNNDGGQGHPVVSAHETAADTLSKFILDNVEFN